MTVLEAGRLRAELAGGGLLSVTSLRADGRELLVPPEHLPEAYRVHGRRAGLTLLHPWANRLGGDDYEQAGRQGRVRDGDPAITRDPAGLPIHGLALEEAWALPESPSRPDRVAIRARLGEHPAFPYPHFLRVEMELTAGGLAVACTLTPAADAPVPVCFGWHPYLHPGGARENWVLALPAHRALELDDAGLPVGKGEERPAGRRPLGADVLDHGLDSIAEGEAMTVVGSRAQVHVALEAGYPAAQLFAPGDADVISLEPMTAPADALRSGRGLRLVEPGGAFTATFRLEVDALPREG